MTYNTQYRLTDVLWWTRQADVLNEIASIMDVESVTTSTEGWFKHRTTASKNIIDKMTEAERAKLQEEERFLSMKGLPEHVQRKWDLKFHCRKYADSFVELPKTNGILGSRTRQARHTKRWA
jgi:hypothetical protein